MFNLTIKQKLFGLAGVIPVTLVVFAIVATYATSLRVKAAAEAERIVEIQTAVSAAKLDLLQARRNEKDFLLRMDTKYIDRHAKTMTDLYITLKKLQEHIKSDEGFDAVSKLNRLSREYEKSIQLMVKVQSKVGLNEKAGLLGSLRKSVHDVEDNLKKFNHDKLIVQMLKMRRHEKDYLARENDKYIARMAERKVEFEVLLAQSSIPAAAQKQITRNMNNYHKDFNALTKGMKEVRALVADFREKIHDTDPAFEAVNQLVRQSRLANKDFQEEVNNKVVVMLAITLLLGGTFMIGIIIILASTITRGLDKAVRVCRDVAEGNLGKEIRLRSDDEIGQLLSSLKVMDANLLRVVTEVQESVGNIGSASSQIASGNLSLSQRTESQASSLEETASSMEEMTSTVKQNADNASHAKQLADENSIKASASADIVSRTINAMNEIDDSSTKISDIIGTIDGIAFQTNLLALNAAVEAARAGEQGRGFAVVATEVRSLAQRSAEAAKEIKELIQDSVAKVKIGNELVTESGEALKVIIDNTKKVAGIVDEIAMASNEQANGIGHVNNAITQMDNMTQENASLVEEAAAASRAMQDQAHSLDELIAFFNIEGQDRKAVRKRADDVALVAKHQPVLQAANPVALVRSDSDDQWKDF